VSPDSRTMEEILEATPESAVAVVGAPGGRWAYRGKAACQNIMCTQDGNPDRCCEIPMTCPECGQPSESGRCFECRGRSMVDPGNEE
jgi:hypothetical protein